MTPSRRKEVEGAIDEFRRAAIVSNAVYYESDEDERRALLAQIEAVEQDALERAAGMCEWYEVDGAAVDAIRALKGKQ